MVYKNNIKKVSIISSALLMLFFYLPTSSHASGSLIVRDRGHHGSYTQVSVGSSAYYYDRGIFYTGSPDNYVVVDAPVGAIVYNVPYGYERVWVDGNVYYRYQDVYYRPHARGYEVVRVDRSREWERGHGHRNNRWHDNREHNERNEHNEHR